MAFDKDDELIRILTDNKALKKRLIFWVIVILLVIFSIVFNLSPFDSMTFNLNTYIPNAKELSEIKVVSYNGENAGDNNVIYIDEENYNSVLNFLFNIEMGAFKAVEGDPNNSVVLTYNGKYKEEYVVVIFYNNFKYVSVSGGQSRIELHKLENPEIAIDFFNEVIAK